MDADTRAGVSVVAAALNQGRTQQLWKVDITDGSGRLIAHGEVRLQNLAGSCAGQRRPTGAWPLTGTR